MRFPLYPFLHSIKLRCIFASLYKKGEVCLLLVPSEERRNGMREVYKWPQIGFNEAS